ncbi:hypothetical protein, partial [Bacteroides fragilis]|uniref:hypothetical protein n=1 Tax=Bacteroides fragilis TaxID=817 RepID=UPI001C705239
GPRIASMELTEDTLSRVSTRATVPVGVYFRLIVFRKSGKPLSPDRRMGGSKSFLTYTHRRATGL